MSAPTITVAAAYHAAKEALDALLDASDRPWEDALLLLTRAATDRRADLMADALWKARFDGLDKASRYQQLANLWTGKPAPEDSTIDAEIKQWFREDR